jgi:2-methylcitrate dehydratase PrpD
VGLTHDLCVIIHGTSSTALGAECVDRVKQAIADGIAVALAGCREPPVAIGAEHARSLGGAPQASVWGWGFKASVVPAACINALDRREQQDASGVAKIVALIAGDPRKGSDH